MTKQQNANIIRVLRLTREMIILADKGDSARRDPSCGVLYGSLRDAAYKLRWLAEKEKDIHVAAGWWDNDDDSIEEGASRRDRNV